MTINKSKKRIASAISVAFAGIVLAGGAYAGVIRNTNPTTGAFLGSCGTTQSDLTACIGAMDLGNIETTIYKADGTVLGPMISATGVYPLMGIGDYFITLVKSGVGNATVAKLSGKDWPVGEPMAVKAVVGDMKTSEGKPNNCIINTSFLDENGTAGVPSYLNSANPEPVICSSYFQSHKRFKIPMQPASLDSTNTPIDLVFNVVDEAVWANEFPANDTNIAGRSATDGLPGDATSNPLKLRPYQFFTKINNYTGQRLSGFKIIIGTGTGTSFVPASSNADTTLVTKLHLSLGLGEGWDKGSGALPNPTKNIFAPDGMATFSAGLFGPIADNFPTVGFFDERAAGYYVTQTCQTGTCPTYLNPAITAAMTTLTPNTLTATDTIYSDTTVTPPASFTSGALASNTMPSNYVGPVMPTGIAGLPFGDWLPFGWEPKGIFWDFDNDPTTDADLVAWWNGSTWLKNYVSGFAPASEAELVAWGTNPLYAVDIVEDTLNLGINFIMKIGDNLDGDNDPNTNSQITIRVIPIVATDQTPPAYITNPPPALPTTLTTTPVVPTTETAPATTTVSDSGGGGGGCSIGSDARFDPTLPAMLFAGLGFLGWRRFKAGK